MILLPIKEAHQVEKRRKRYDYAVQFASYPSLFLLCPGEVAVCGLIASIGLFVYEDLVSHWCAARLEANIQMTSSPFSSEVRERSWPAPTGATPDSVMLSRSSCDVKTQRSGTGIFFVVLWPHTLLKSGEMFPRIWGT